MHARSPLAFLAAATFVVVAAHAQTPVVTFAGENLRLRSASVTAAGANAFNATLVMEDDNANASLGTSFRRWWHCQIGNLNAAGTTWNVRVDNAGYSDVILPVWALSTDGGASFGAYTRLPLSALPTVVGSTSHRFTVTTPVGVNAIRLAKYFPYTVTLKDAFVQSISGNAKVRSIAAIGSSRQGRPITRIELTDSAVSDAGKSRVWIHAGIHPAETTSYFTVEGLVQWLLSNDPAAALLLHSAIVDIVPMANPDGVFLGNYRTNAASVNLEDEWASPYNSSEPEIVALRTAIEGCMGTAAAPAGNPIRVLLNLHSSHNVSYPFLYMHTVNPTWNPTTNNAGVIPAVYAKEQLWITQLFGQSPFAALGTTLSSSAGAPSRPFVESMMHDRWSAQPTWTGAPNSQPVVMAITLEGTYGRGPDQVTWNTPADYRLLGEQTGRTLVEHLGLQYTAQATAYGSSCGTLGQGSATHASGGVVTVDLMLTGAPANGFGWLVFGFQQTGVPLPPPWNGCWQWTSMDAVLGQMLSPVGAASYALTVPHLPGLVVNAQWVAADLLTAPLQVFTSNAVQVRNNF